MTWWVALIIYAVGVILCLAISILLSKLNESYNIINNKNMFLKNKNSLLEEHEDEIFILKSKLNLKKKFTIHINLVGGMWVIIIKSVNGKEVCTSNKSYRYKCRAIEVAGSLSKSSGWELKVDE